MTIRTAQVVWLGPEDIQAGKIIDAAVVKLGNFKFEAVDAVKMAEAAIYTDINGDVRLIKTKY